MHAKDALGKYGEDLAVRHLEDHGLTVLERNCEVKTRRSTAYGTPVEAVTPRKARRLRRLALQWLDEKQMFAPTIRFDVVGIVQPTHGPASIVHVRGID